MKNLITDKEKNDARTEIDSVLEGYIESFYEKIPFAKHQKDSENINMDFYKRHSIETPIRIKLKRTVDSLVIHHFTKTNPEAAKKWANYTDDEMLHGHMFAKDIERMWGLSFQEVISTEPLISTKLLNGYFYYNFEYEGPMAAIASAYFLEYVTSRTQPVWLDNLERVLGKDAVKGARAHVNHDLGEDHSSFVWDTLMATINTTNDIEKLKKHLSVIFGLFCAYMKEVYTLTVENKNADSIQNSATNSVESALSASA